MTVLAIKEVLDRVIGNICPVGDSAIDDQRYENLVHEIELLDMMLRDVELVSREVNYPEWSRQRAGIAANNFLTEVKEDYYDYQYLKADDLEAEEIRREGAV